MVRPVTHQEQSSANSIIVTRIHRFSCYFAIRTVVHMHRSTDTTSLTSDIRTADDVVELARAVVRDGVSTHAEALSNLGGAAASVGADPVLIRLLDDRTAPDAVRARAVARLARQWPVAAGATESGAAATFCQLLARWNAHQDLRSSDGADVAELSASRWRLDDVRRAHRAARRTHAVRPAG
jgi:hypothetical protein